MRGDAGGKIFLEVAISRIPPPSSTLRPLSLATALKIIGVGFHAGFGAVQIHHMDPLRPGLPEGLRGSQGILRHPVGGGKNPP